MLNDVIRRLRAAGNPKAVEGMNRYGIRGGCLLGVSVPVLRAMAREIGRNHALALKLWRSGYHEARILAGMIACHAMVDDALMEAWAHDFDSWDVCDQCCLNLFDQLPQAWDKAHEWSAREEEFVKRAGFVLMARLAVRDKTSPDIRFEPFFAPIEREAGDSRNFVKKAVNWALRQIGKRSPGLNRKAIAAARRIARRKETSARWIATDALRELTDPRVSGRLSAPENSPMTHKRKDTAKP